jgi:DNA repair protein RadA/Sms
VAQTASRLKEAQKLGFARAILPDAARAEGSSEPGLSLQPVGSLASLVADIAARGRTDARRHPSDDRRRNPDDRGPPTDARTRKADAG